MINTPNEKPTAGEKPRGNKRDKLIFECADGERGLWIWAARQKKGQTLPQFVARALNNETRAIAEQMKREGKPVPDFVIDALAAIKANEI
jgi:hypothetical protein